MNKALVKAVINVCGAAFIIAGLAAIFLNFKAIAGALILILAGASLLLRKQFGLYCMFFLAFIIGGIGLIIAGLAAFDILHKNYKFDMLLIGLAPVAISLLAFYFLTRRETAGEFGLEKIAILEKVDKKELKAAARIFLWIAAIIAVVLLACYMIVRMMAH